MEKELFDDLVTALNEAIEHEKGNIKLRSHIIETPAEKIDELFIEKFKKLSDINKLEAMKIVDKLYYAEVQ